VLAQGVYPRMTPDGQLLFTRVRSLWAVRLDVSRLAIVGEPVPVLEAVQTQTSGLSQFDIAADGTFAYRQAGIAGGFQRLVWFGRDQQTTPAVNEQLTGIYHPPPHLSPDGRRLAVTIHLEGGEDQVVVYDLERGIRTPIGAGPRMDSRWPVWTPDGTRITFASTSAGTYDIYSVPAAGGAPEPLLVREQDQWPQSWSSDGRVLAFIQTGRGAGGDIWMLPRGGEPAPFVVTPFNERTAAFSPDGRWLAYDSNESGRFEVYVQPYPGPGEKVRISTSGGAEPVWARDGTALFYRVGQRDLMTVSIGSGPTLRVGAPRSLVQVRLWGGDSAQYFDVAPDGRFVGIENPNASLPSLIVVQNWDQELKRLVPAK
jgi:WD40 repeat protein